MQSPKVLGLIADPDLGQIFIRNLAKLLLKCNFKPTKTVQRAAHIDPELQTAVDNLFKPSWHATYRRQFAVLPPEGQFVKLSCSTMPKRCLPSQACSVRPSSTLGYMHMYMHMHTEIRACTSTEQADGRMNA